ncbi:PilN domain-containing protein [Metabacillus malikii]|uniref:Type IV pilus assembly protein PilN n=1 Tax=Metabacillus malikii TaxID=1504265 RepID=A0ABT9ZNM8_9BACI|nr:hypothetical protein [Metabacillus malikii]MDQ0232820.1 type IV pilus assembly protein PilN [Metabacillus malikii]
MLAEINLLPRRDRKNQAKRAIILLIAMITLITSLLFFFQTRSILQENEQVTSKNRTLQGQLEEKLANQNELKQNSSVEILQSAVNFADAISKDVLPYLEELVALLPERGFFINYEQADPRSIKVVIQFDSNREAAFYLARLKESPTFVNVFLSELNSQIELDEEQALEATEKIVPRVLATYELEVKSTVRIIENGGENNED